MAANKEYTRRSDAVRAAKKEHGEDWASKVEIIERETADGKRWVYDAPRIEPATLADAVVEVLNQHSAEIAQKAASKRKIQKSKPIHEPVTLQSIQAEGADIPAPQKIDHEAATKAGDKAANAAIVNVDPLKPRLSTCERPTKRVWDIADSMPEASRKEVIAACVAAGIAYGTSRTQYQHWFKQKNESATEPRAMVKDGKVIPPASTARH